ncbi:ribonuclease H protein [Trifolium medium]|uniref:Ribonuclease H protein n=1 Tax=Trifolium medium TaxID=97028 RepID=A0A392MTG9_9FABA|nr:ribonuclease H protein [Trifolium medium]
MFLIVGEFVLRISVLDALSCRRRLDTVYLRVQKLYAFGGRVGWIMFYLHLLMQTCFAGVETNDVFFNNTKATVHNIVAKVQSMLSFCTTAFETYTSGSSGISEQRLDSLQAVSLIKDGVSHFHTFANEIHIIRQLLHRDWNVVINHVLREGNVCADVLAKIGASSNSPIVVLESPSPELSNSLGADAWGVVFIRE